MRTRQPLRAATPAPSPSRRGRLRCAHRGTRPGPYAPAPRIPWHAPRTVRACAPPSPPLRTQSRRTPALRGQSRRRAARVGATTPALRAQPRRWGGTGGRNLPALRGQSCRWGGTGGRDGTP
ncbi:hypothetical protein GCM10010415_59830 [Streptomyces atrovirens]